VDTRAIQDSELLRMVKKLAVVDRAENGNTEPYAKDCRGTLCCRLVWTIVYRARGSLLHFDLLGCVTRFVKLLGGQLLQGRACVKWSALKPYQKV
jgi:hypothetical protein